MIFRRLPASSSFVLAAARLRALQPDPGRATRRPGHLRGRSRRTVSPARTAGRSHRARSVRPLDSGGPYGCRMVRVMECAQLVMEGRSIVGPGRQPLGPTGGGCPRAVEDAAVDCPQLPAVRVERLIGREAQVVLEVRPPVAAGYAIRRYLDLLHGDDLAGHDGCLPPLPPGTRQPSARRWHPRSSCAERPPRGGPGTIWPFPGRRFPSQLASSAAARGPGNVPDISGKIGHDHSFPPSWPAGRSVPARLHLP